MLRGPSEGPRLRKSIYGPPEAPQSSHGGHHGSTPMTPLGYQDLGSPKGAYGKPLQLVGYIRNLVGQVLRATAGRLRWDIYLNSTCVNGYRQCVRGCTSYTFEYSLYLNDRPTKGAPQCPLPPHCLSPC